jgi:predicted MFS family arabinose efflux permease
MLRRLETREGDRGRAYRWYALALLTATYACCTVSRFSISAVIEPIKHEFGISDAGMGMVGGMGLSIAFAAMAMPAGWLVDRVNRRRLLSASLAIWSVFTLLGGITTSYLSLLATRIAIGATESVAAPTSLSIITDLFPPRQRATAVSIFYTSIYIGTGIAFLGGGLIAAAFGWRAVLIIAGAPGLVLALICWFSLRDTQRGSADPLDAHGDKAAREAPPVVVVFGHLAASSALRQTVIAMTLGSFATGSTIVWLASFFIRTHGSSPATAGLTVALGLGLAQAIGAAISGPLADRFASKRPCSMAFVPASALLLTVPAGLAMIYAPSFTSAVFFTLVLGLGLGAWIGPGYSLVLDGTSPHMRGTMVGIVNMIINILGFGLGPIATGLLSDHIELPGALGRAMSIVLLANLFAAGLFLLVAVSPKHSHAEDFRRA